MANWVTSIFPCVGFRPPQAGFKNPPGARLPEAKDPTARPVGPARPRVDCGRVKQLRVLQVAATRAEDERAAVGVVPPAVIQFRWVTTSAHSASYNIRAGYFMGRCTDLGKENVRL